MSRAGDHFHVPGSPLDGRPVPRDWNRLELPAKRRVLLARGWARSWEDAGRKLSAHARASMALRRERERRRQMEGPRPRDGKD